MHAQLFAGLLAIAMLVTSGVTSSTGYLCHVEGKIHAVRCCKPSRATASAAAFMQPADDCCELALSIVKHAPALVETRAEPGLLAALVALLPVLLRLEQPALSYASYAREVGPPPTACGPPHAGLTVPLFVRHCSYLI